MDGHKPSVLSVTALSQGTFASGGADKLIKIWDSNGTLIRTLEGHTDGVRQLVATELGLCSCSNDGYDEADSQYFDFFYLLFFSLLIFILVIEL